MATFKVTGPDGATYNVTAPDDATDEDVRAFVQSQAGGQESKPLTWSDVPKQALRNAGQSAVNLGRAMAQPFVDPVGTAKGLGHIAAGVGSKIVGAADTASEFLGGPDLQTPEQKEYAERAVNQVGTFIKDRYGGVENIKRTLATDPVGAAADAAMMLYGGGAMLPGRAGTAIKAAGSAIDPIRNVGRAAGAATKAGGKVASNVLGVTTGTGTLPIEQAFKAGRQGNRTFVENMRGYAPMSDTLDMAERGVSKLVKERSNQYGAWNPLPGSKQQINMQPLDNAVTDGMNMAARQGVVLDKSAAKVMQEVSDAVDTFKANGWTTPADLDQLKQIVYDIGGEAKQGSRAHKAAMGVYHSIGNELRAQVPGYAQTMKDYGTASELIKEMRSTLSLNNKATADTKLRKLQSVMRNNVNTNYGARTRLVDELARREPNLPAALAGQAMSSPTPRGLAQGSAGAMALYGGMSLNPLALAALPLASPSVVGELSHASGRIARAGNQVGRLSPASPQQIGQALMLAQLLGRTTLDEE